MFDAASWIEALKRLMKHSADGSSPDVHYVHEEIAPGLSAEEFQALAQDPTIPAVLLDFWHLGSMSLDCGFVIRRSARNDGAFARVFPDVMKVVIGVNFLSPAQSAARSAELHMNNVESDALEGAHKQCPEECIAFSDLGNGDYLAIDTSSGVSDPPVVYLSHESCTSFVVCPHFTAFMRFWQDWCFLHPFYLRFPVERDTVASSDSQITTALHQLLFDA